MTKSWKQIYPRDCYRKLLVMSGETGLSFPKVVNIVVREGLIRLGEIPETTSLAQLLNKDGNILIDPHVEAVERQLTNAFKQWKSMKTEAKTYYIDKAREYEKLPIAQEILKVTSNEG